MSYAEHLHRDLIHKKVVVASGDSGAISQPNWGSYIRQAVKFKLPAEGRIFEDPELRGLDPAEPLHLPFSTLVLEHSSKIETPGLIQKEYLTKFVIYVSDILVSTYEAARSGDPKLSEILESRNLDISESPSLFISAWAYCPQRHSWFHFPVIGLATENWTLGHDENGFLSFRVQASQENLDTFTDAINHVLLTVAGFLNALACSNVEVGHAGKTPKPGKPPLPFDDYRTLVLKPTHSSGRGLQAKHGDHRAPREHLRRGHIRRLTHLDGRRIWINAAVVNAGAPGTIHKDYKLVA